MSVLRAMSCWLQALKGTNFFGQRPGNASPPSSLKRRPHRTLLQSATAPVELKCGPEVCHAKFMLVLQAEGFFDGHLQRHSRLLVRFSRRITVSNLCSAHATFHASYLYCPVDGLHTCHLCILCEFQLNGYSNILRKRPCSDEGLLCLPYWPMLHVLGKLRYWNVAPNPSPSHHCALRCKHTKPGPAPSISFCHYLPSPFGLLPDGSGAAAEMVMKRSVVLPILKAAPIKTPAIAHAPQALLPTQGLCWGS